MIDLHNAKIAAAGEGAALLDLGDGICCLEFHSKGNSITPEIKEFVLDLLEKDLLGFDGMVIGSQSKNFSAGADLNSMLEKITRNRFDLFYSSINYFQQMNFRIKYYHKPIVAAPYGMTLGGGLEIALHSHRRVARENVYMGLVEVGVGLLPGGGGSKETALCMRGLTPAEDAEEICSLYERLLLGAVSKNAKHAVQMRYLKESDGVASNPDTQIDAAKEACISLLEHPLAQGGPERVTLSGQAAYKLMVAHGERLLEEGKAAPYDLHIGKYIALILAGSDVFGPQQYTEQQILDAERACFIGLLKQPETRARIEHFLATGKKLRN